MDYMLEVMQIPVTDIDRAKAFYLDRMGCSLVVDRVDGGTRTPSRSGSRAQRA
jgi:catechol 2,3-dioxygenase-like lactoylglutathione lyase family enzyme